MPTHSVDWNSMLLIVFVAFIAVELLWRRKEKQDKKQDKIDKLKNKEKYNETDRDNP